MGRVSVWFQGSARDLYPGSFALVMATGIVSVAAHLLGLDMVSWPLLGLNVVAYLGLWLLLVMRLRLCPASVWADLADPARGPGVLTLAAGTCVLGSQVRLLTGSAPAAAGLMVLGAALWVGLTYAFLLAVVVRGRKPGLARSLNGSWLLLAVSPQAVSILGGLLAGDLAAPEPLLLAALLVYLLGCLLYVVLVALVVYRLVFVRLEPADFTPDYWISMGAAAISSLAGATLLAASARSSLLGELRPFLAGLTLLFWAAATWWVPLLVALEVWRVWHVWHVWHVWRVWHARPARWPRLACGAPAWGRVFPLGMYTVATLEVARTTGPRALLAAPGSLLGVALLAWLLTLIGSLPQVVGLNRPAAGSPDRRNGPTARTAGFAGTAGQPASPPPEGQSAGAAEQRAPGRRARSACSTDARSIN